MISETLIGALIGACSLAGCIINSLIVVIIWRSTKLQSSFALLTVSLAVFDGLFSMLFLLYTTPMMLFDIPILRARSALCGYFLMICYDTNASIHFIISLNRFLAVFTPISYHKVFSVNFTRCILLLTVLISFSCITLFFQILGCDNYYNSEVRAFQYSQQEVCRLFGLYGDFYQELTLTLIAALLDVITIRRVVRMRAKSAKSVRELNLLKQSISQSTFLLFIVLVMTLAPKLELGNDYAFIFSSLLWLSLHSFDGVFTLIFNHEIRTKLSGSSIAPKSWNSVVL